MNHILAGSRFIALAALVAMGLAVWPRFADAGASELQMEHKGGNRSPALPRTAQLAKPPATPVDAAKAAKDAKDLEEWKKLLAQITQLRMAGKAAEALPLAERLVALSAAMSGPASNITANDIGTLAEIQAAAGKYAEAEASVKRAIAILEKNGDALALYFLPHHLLTLGNLYAEQSRFAEAEPYLKRVIAMKEKVESRDAQEQVAITYDALGKLYVKWGLYAESEPAFKRAMEMLEKLHGRDSVPVGVILNNLANLYSAQGRYADAEAVMVRAVALYEKGGGFLAMLSAPNTLLGPMLGNLALIYQSQGRYSEAEGLLKRALAIAEKDTDKSHLALALNNMATLYREQGRSAEAEPLMKRALDTVEKLSGANHPLTASLLSNLAILYDKSGRKDEAFALHMRALALREATLGPNHPDVALSLHNLALHYVEQERYADAEALLKRAFAVREKVLTPGHPDLAAGLSNLAELYRQQHRPTEAEPLYQRALAINEKALGPNHADTGLNLHNLAGFYADQGRFIDSTQAYKRSLTIWLNTLGADHPYVATSLNNVADVYFRQQDWAQSADFWQKSTDILIRRFKRGLENGGSSGGGNSKSEIEQESSRFWRLVKASYRLSLAKPAETQQIGARMFEAAQWAQGSATVARSLALMAARKAKGQGALPRLIREQQDLSAEWQVKDKLLAAARSQPGEKRNARGEDGLRRRMAEIDARLTEIAGALAKDFPEYESFASPDPLSVAETQRLLKDNEALVLFLDTPEKATVPEETFIWVVTKTATRWVRASLGTPGLRREVQALRCGLDFDGAWGKNSKCPELLGVNYTDADFEAGKPLPFNPKRAHELYKVLFGQIEDMIRNKRLLIVAAGPLSQLPFQVLVTQPVDIKRQDQPAMRQIQWLVRSNSLTVLPAVSSLRALRRDAKASQGGKAYFGIGNPLLDGSDSRDAARARLSRDKQVCPKQPAPEPMPNTIAPQRSVSRVIMQGGHVASERIRVQSPLPETADELCAVADTLQAGGGSVLLGGQASEASVKSMSEQGSLAGFRIVHFATHGALAGQIESGSEPGLLLTPPKTSSDIDDGYLSASEIINLKLDADWVILSACNTAGGENSNAEALSGLGRSFFYAGARSMLVSHWAVESRATVKLVTTALSAMTADAKNGRAEAMQRAMLTLIDTGAAREAHPSYWAPFVVVGEGGR